MRIVWTKDTLFITRPKESRIIDRLPLFQIQAVLDMNEEADLSSRQGSILARSRSYLSEKKETADSNPASTREASIFSRNSAIKYVLQIKTDMNSEIAGRTLYLSTRNEINPEQRRQAVVSSLWSAVVAAQKKAIAVSRFQKSQEKVRKIQGSLSFQIAMAILIMLVLTRIRVHPPARSPTRHHEAVRIEHKTAVTPSHYMSSILSTIDTQRDVDHFE
jgi:hypothetical protein